MANKQIAYFLLIFYNAEFSPQNTLDNSGGYALRNGTIPCM